MKVKTSVRKSDKVRVSILMSHAEYRDLDDALGGVFPMLGPLQQLYDRIPLYTDLPPVGETVTSTKGMY